MYMCECCLKHDMFIHVYPQLDYNSAGATFCNAPWSKFFQRTGIQPSELWSPSTVSLHGNTTSCVARRQRARERGGGRGRNGLRKSGKELDLKIVMNIFIAHVT